jgi:DNA-binding LacI/PurR family transcriptional regulator
MVSTPWTEQGSFVESLFSGIRQEAAHSSFTVTYYSDSPVPSPETVAERKIDGVLAVAPLLDNLPAIQRLYEAKVPVVGLAVRDRVGRLPVVCTDNYGGMYKAVKYLISLGHRRIAYVSESIDSSDVFERLLGFQSAFAEAGLQADPSYLLMNSHGISPSYFEYWFENLPVMPTAILFGIQLAVPAIRMLARKRIRIPEDISLIVTDDPETEWGIDRTLTCVHQPIFEMGRRAAEKLKNIIEGSDSGEQEVIPTELIIKDSVSSPKESPAGGSKAS